MKCFMPAIFNTVNYWSFKVPNYEKILEFSNKKTEKEIDNTFFPWSKQCNIGVIPITSTEFQHLLQPSIELFSDSIGRMFHYILHDPWINVYKKGSFQEPHTHEPHDMSCVLFLNTGEDFSNFYFFNRYDISYPLLWKTLLNIDQQHYPKVEDGTIIFFPSTTLHGVTAHNSNIMRRTISCNLELTIM